MQHLRVFHSNADALAAARRLIEHGVLVGVQQTQLGKGELYPGMAFGTSGGHFALVLVHEDERALATAVLAAMAAEAAVDAGGAIGEAWDEREPDLSRLPEGFAPACPGCGGGLPLEASLERCTVCGEAVDVVGLIVKRHGPEALEACYGDDEDMGWPSDAVLVGLALECGGCRYPLAGLEAQGDCPECGAGYDKRRILNRMLGLTG